MLHLPPTLPHIPNHIALSMPRSRVAASATEWRAAALVAHAAPPNSAAASRRDVRGWRAERSHFQLFLNRKLELEVGRVSCGLDVSVGMCGRFEFRILAVVPRQRGPQHRKQYRIRVHKKIARSVFLTG
jgi:hypothetical protein